jgi:hypothetical protein
MLAPHPRSQSTALRITHSTRTSVRSLGAFNCAANHPQHAHQRTLPGCFQLSTRVGGVAQNVSLVNTVLNTMIAEEWNLLCDKVDAGAKPIEVAQVSSNPHREPERARESSLHMPRDEDSSHHRTRQLPLPSPPFKLRGSW